MSLDTLQELIAKITDGRLRDQFQLAADALRVTAPETEVPDDTHGAPTDHELKRHFLEVHPGFDLLIGDPLYRVGNDAIPVPTEWVIAYATATAPDGTVETYEAVGKGTYAALMDLQSQMSGRHSFHDPYEEDAFGRKVFRFGERDERR